MPIINPIYEHRINKQWSSLRGQICSGSWMLLTHKVKTTTHVEWETRFDPKEDIQDPLEKMNLPENKVKSNLSLRVINKEELRMAMKKLKKKKSAGTDNLTQEQLVLGVNALSDPLLI